MHLLRASTCWHIPIAVTIVQWRSVVYVWLLGPVRSDSSAPRFANLLYNGLIAQPLPLDV